MIGADQLRNHHRENRRRVNDPTQRYQLDSLPGAFSGLHLLSLMHVGLKRFDADADPGTNLDREYRLAQSLRGQQNP